MKRFLLIVSYSMCILIFLSIAWVVTDSIINSDPYAPKLIGRDSFCAYWVPAWVISLKRLGISVCVISCAGAVLVGALSRLEKM